MKDADSKGTFNGKDGLGKGEVESSILSCSTINFPAFSTTSVRANPRLRKCSQVYRTFLSAFCVQNGLRCAAFPNRQENFLGSGRQVFGP